MMGTQAAPERLFYDFCLDEHVPLDHILRQIDRFLDLSDVRQELKPFYSHIGRPSIDPELMIRMLIRRVLLRHPLRAPPVRGGASQSCLSRSLETVHDRTCRGSCRSPAEGLAAPESISLPQCAILFAHATAGRPRVIGRGHRLGCISRARRRCRIASSPCVIPTGQDNP